MNPGISKSTVFNSNTDVPARQEILRLRIEKVKSIRSLPGLTLKQKYALFIETRFWKAMRVEKKKLVPACELCGSVIKLHVHHLRYKSWWDCLMEDLQVLCELCHNRHHREERR